ncbi:MAG: DUF4229 domain-containing protein [Actinomycetota bacterium]|nr:DUF4229 domain-containing protein [Actinomycetota bacterium]
MVKAALVYTAARLAIFAVLLAVLWALGLGSFPGILFALLLSTPVAYFLLGKQRGALVSAIAQRRQVRADLRARLRGSSDREPDREQDAKQ